jgi:hypothetical protein
MTLKEEGTTIHFRSHSTHWGAPSADCEGVY